MIRTGNADTPANWYKQTKIKKCEKEKKNRTVFDFYHVRRWESNNNGPILLPPQNLGNTQPLYSVFFVFHEQLSVMHQDFFVSDGLLCSCQVFGILRRFFLFSCPPYPFSMCKYYSQIWINEEHFVFNTGFYFQHRSLLSMILLLISLGSSLEELLWSSYLRRKLGRVSLVHLLRLLSQHL